MTTKSPAQIFTELTAKDKNDVWHEIKSLGSKIHDHYPTCSCGENFLTKTELERHIKESNPTYSNPADILNRMKEFCGEERYRKFTLRIGTLSRDWSNNYTYYIEEKYILNPSLLLEEAVEFLKGRK